MNTHYEHVWLNSLMCDMTLQNTTWLLNIYTNHTPIWPKSGPFPRVFWMNVLALSERKRIFWKPKKLTKSTVGIGVWVWFRIPQTSPNVRARWVAKTAARFYHSKFETNTRWLRYLFEAFLVWLYSQLQIGWHIIWRLFLKTFNLVPGVAGFSWDLLFITWY